MSNPFKPTAGSNPPELIGRQDQIDDFNYALDDGAGAPGRLMFLTGPRGIGKTVLLNALGDVARGRKWEVIHETASHGFLQRIVSALSSKHSGPRTVKLPSVSADLPVAGAAAGVNLGEVSFERDQSSLTFRAAATKRLESLERRKHGLLITLDEVQAAALGENMEELRALATGAQHLIREGRNVAFIFAGLPTAVEEMLNDDVLTFLRRAERVHLEDIPLDEVEDSFRETIESNEKGIGQPVLDQLTESTGGYPFMIQLVGYWVWRYAEHDDVIGPDAAQRGIAKAKANIGNLVHAPEFTHLTPMQKDYLLAMAQDDGPSRTADIAKRLHRSAQAANNFRAQLIDADVIMAPAYGTVDFKMPYMREYLRGHAASRALFG